MATSPNDLLERAKNADGLQGLIKQGIGGALLAVATGIISGVLSFANIWTSVFDAFGSALSAMVQAIWGAPANIVLAGAQATINSLLGPWNLGPFTFALAIGSVLLGLYIVVAYLSEEPTGNFIPGLPFDIPTPGLEGPEEDDGEGG